MFIPVSNVLIHTKSPPRTLRACGHPSFYLYTMHYWCAKRFCQSTSKSIFLGLLSLMADVAFWLILILPRGYITYLYLTPIFKTDLPTLSSGNFETRGLEYAALVMCQGRYIPAPSSREIEANVKERWIVSQPYLRLWDTREIPLYRIDIPGEPVHLCCYSCVSGNRF